MDHARPCCRWTAAIVSIAGIALLACVASCGGGGGGGDTSTTTSTVSPTTLFSSSPTSLPDLTGFTQGLCQTGTVPFVSLVAPVDLNRDGRLDLLVHIWCFVSPPGTVFSGPTNNVLIALLQKSDGSFSIGNQQVFGAATVDLGGASRKVRVADLNGDGYMDLAYAINQEDGRAQSGGGTNQAAQAALVRSNGDGTYSIDKLGQPDWLHSIDVPDNEVGGSDVVFQGFNNVGTQAFRYSSGAWNSIGTYPELSGLTFMFYPRSSPTVGSAEMVSGELSDPAALDLYLKSNGTWSVVDSYVIPSQQVPFITWQGTQTTATLITLNGNAYVGAAFDESCLLRLAPGSPQLYVANLNAQYLPGGYQGGTVNQSGLSNFNGLFAFDTSGNTLNLLSSTFVNQENDFTGNFFDCKDLNGDGYQDVVLYAQRTGGVPIIYLNNKHGQLAKYDTSSFPQAPTSYGAASSLYADFDGDGVADLLYFPQALDSSGKLVLLLYRGVNNLK